MKRTTNQFRHHPSRRKYRGKLEREQQQTLPAKPGARAQGESRITSEPLQGPKRIGRGYCDNPYCHTPETRRKEGERERRRVGITKARTRRRRFRKSAECFWKTPGLYKEAPKRSYNQLGTSPWQESTKQLSTLIFQPRPPAPQTPPQPGWHWSNTHMRTVIESITQPGELSELSQGRLPGKSG